MTGNAKRELEKRATQLEDAAIKQAEEYRISTDYPRTALARIAQAELQLKVALLLRQRARAEIGPPTTNVRT